MSGFALTLDRLNALQPRSSVVVSAKTLSRKWNMVSRTQAAKAEIVLSQAAFSAALRQALKDARSRLGGLQIDIHTCWSLHVFVYMLTEGEGRERGKGRDLVRKSSLKPGSLEGAAHAETAQEYRAIRNDTHADGDARSTHPGRYW